ncbi:hypothetical protein [Pseudoramibacter porci]|uniref:Uncharacterized protein n=1 Tax=Pseudoramibacter porci TaxID=2606631 RepID=A0A7X2TBA3_9FIRM|nr:hypothetical protein [Pseudoramibacter porci]MSS20336.1 hypothetical protein [Pseudoramibacter porci]
MTHNDLNINLICEVVPGNRGGDVKLQWLAGIKKDESIGILRPDWLNLKDKKVDFKSDGPEKVGKIGVWNWSIQIDPNDADIVHIQSKYNENIKPIEIIILEQKINSQEEIPNYIRSNEVTASNNGCSMLICFPSSEENMYYGINCTDEAFKITNSKLYLEKNIKKLPVYSIYDREIIKTERHDFYYLPKLTQTSNYIELKNSREILIDLLIERSEWSSLSVKGLTERDCKTINKYLNSFLSRDFYEEFATKSGCSLTDAKAICRDFVENNHAYLKEKIDGENQFLCQILENNRSLREKYEKIIDNKWHEESDSKIEAKQKELDELKRKIKKDKREHKKWEKESTEKKENVQKEIETLKQEIENEKLALKETQSERTLKEKELEAIQKQIFENQKIMKEKEKVYADRLVVGLNQTSNIERAQNSAASLFIKGQPLADDDIDEFSDREDFFECMADNLEMAAGMNAESNNLLKGIARFLYAAYLKKIPVLLAGPNAKNIADAFSAAVFGKCADQFYCEGDFQYTKLKEMSESEFVTINNVFHADWIDHIDEITGSLNECWFTNAFAENLIIEPKGLYNYMIPIVTDLFVTGRSTKDYYGKQAKNFEFKETSRANKNTRQFFKEIGSGSLYRKNIETVLKTLGGMPGYCEDWDYYFALLPYAVVTGNENSLIEILESSDQNVSKDCRNIIEQYLGENQ